MTICSIPSSPQHQHAVNNGKNYAMYKTQQTVANHENKVLEVSSVGGDAIAQSLVEWRWPLYPEWHTDAGKLVHPADLLDLGNRMPLCYCAFDDIVTQPEACTANLGVSARSKGNRFYLTCHLFNGAITNIAKEMKKRGQQVNPQIELTTVCGYFVEMSHMYTKLTSAASDQSTASEDEESVASGFATPQKATTGRHPLHGSMSSPATQMRLTQTTPSSSRSSTKRARHFSEDFDGPFTPAPIQTSNKSTQGTDDNTPTKPVSTSVKTSVAEPPPTYHDTEWMAVLLPPPERKSAKKPKGAASSLGTATDPFIIDALDVGSNANISAGSQAQGSRRTREPTQPAPMPAFGVSGGISIKDFMEALNSPTGLTISAFKTWIWCCPICGVYMLVNQREEHEGTMYCGGTY
ncbi:hypothetical protein FRC03_011614 [Tulasnella sp. 419]|nr:hypothetical protein FRC03_011614 [Tulasnella sp. 419]